MNPPQPPSPSGPPASRFVAIWVPDWPVVALTMEARQQRRHPRAHQGAPHLPDPATEPVAVVGARGVLAASAPARRAGITTGSATLTVTTFIAATVAVVVVVLGGDQQPGQQPLHHTGQRSASGQGPQQARHALRAGHGLRRRVPARRTQRPGRTTSRVTRKHTTFEHMYSIASGARAPHAEAGSRNTGTATISRISGAFIDGAFSSRSRRDGPPRPLEPRWAPPT